MNAVAVTATARALNAVYQTRNGADATALRLAIATSPSGVARRVEFVQWAYCAKEGGPAFEHFVRVEGWGVREVPARELALRQQSGLRREIDRLLENAEHAAARAKQLVGTKFAARHTVEAGEFRERARVLETRVTLSVARAV